MHPAAPRRLTLDTAAPILTPRGQAFEGNLEGNLEARDGTSEAMAPASTAFEDAIAAL